MKQYSNVFNSKFKCQKVAYNRKNQKVIKKEFYRGQNIYILFAGREVRIEKNCARGLEYGPRPQAEGRAQDRGHRFSQYGPTKAGK